jgi:hypothetical protein
MRDEVLGSISFEVLKATRCATAQMTDTRLALRVWASLPSVETEDLLKRGRKQVKDWSELKEVLRLGLAFLTVSGVRALLSFFGILAPAAGTERTEELCNQPSSARSLNRSPTIKWFYGNVTGRW